MVSSFSKMYKRKVPRANQFFNNSLGDTSIDLGIHYDNSPITCNTDFFLN